MNDQLTTIPITLPACWERLIATPSIEALPIAQRGGRVAPTADDPKAYWGDYRTVEAVVETPGGLLKGSVALDSREDRYASGYQITLDGQTVAAHHHAFVTLDFLTEPISGVDGRRYQFAVTWSPADPLVDTAAR